MKRILGAFIILAFIVCLAGCTTSTRNSASQVTQINTQGTTPTQTPVNVNFIPSTTESLTDRNIRTVKEIVEEYHNTHTYSLSDMFVCGDMATDVWNMVKTRGIDAVIYIGNVDKDITTIEEANHAWVLAEISPNMWVALETTGGFIVCDDPSICPINNLRYYKGWKFNNPKELKDTLDKLQHPCSEGYILGIDNLCHLACGGNYYCTGSSICINGECRGCDPGYILGEDLKCHQSCGGSSYCTGSSICIDGECRGCDPGYYLGTDLRCHKY